LAPNFNEPWYMFSMIFPISSWLTWMTSLLILGNNLNAWNICGLSFRYVTSITFVSTLSSVFYVS
jgi:hypothetical protein